MLVMSLNKPWPWKQCCPFGKLTQAIDFMSSIPYEKTLPTQPPSMMKKSVPKHRLECGLNIWVTLNDTRGKRSYSGNARNLVSFFGDRWYRSVSPSVINSDNWSERVCRLRQLCSCYILWKIQVCEPHREWHAKSKQSIHHLLHQYGSNIGKSSSEAVIETQRRQV